MTDITGKNETSRPNNDWERKARALVRGEMVMRDISYAELSQRLRLIGIEETPSNLRTKINRGAFKAAFLLQFMRALDIKAVEPRWDGL